MIATNKLLRKRDIKKSSSVGTTGSSITVSSEEASQIDELEVFKVTSGTKVLYSDFDILKNPNR